MNAFLQEVDVGDYTVEGEVCSYSCKQAGADKKLSRSLEEDLAASPPSAALLGTSPVGPLSEVHSRKTLVYLILTLNNQYPDYDFSLLRAQNFSKESGMQGVRDNVETLLLEASGVWAREHPGKVFTDYLWATVGDAIGLEDCSVYSYNPEYGNDPFGEEGNIWSFNYFFYNKKLKRILYFACKAKSKAGEGAGEGDELPSPSRGGAEEDEAYAGPFEDMEL